jgi:nicotinate-nucleotide adenylyltransferase
MKIGVFVGSFNPVHKSHIKIARISISNGIVDKVLIIPTNNYWNKTNIIDLKYRIEMLKYYETDKIIIDEKHNNYEYTYEIINALKKENPDDEFSLIIGADNIINFDKWMNYEELLKLNLIIFKRNDIDVKYYLDKLNKKDNYSIVELSNGELSSSKARNNINNIEKLKKYLDDEIIEYIIKNKLYGK